MNRLSLVKKHLIVDEEKRSPIEWGERTINYLCVRPQSQHCLGEDPRAGRHDR
jgi:hypothetical protein